MPHRRIHSPPSRVVKDQIGPAIRFTIVWRVVGDDQTECVLEQCFDQELWKLWTAAQRKEVFILNVVQRLTDDASVAHLRDQMIRDLKLYADAYDWDRDRKVHL